MQLDISTEEAAVLTDVLDSALGDIREEVYKSETAEYKTKLKGREAIIAALLERVRARSISA